MRKLFFSLSFALAAAMPLSAQESATETDSLGLPGDNFDLYGALELFKTAKSVEAFEEAINKKDNEINNLDLNEDGQTDYIQVIDEMEKDTHAVILRVAVNESESQDVAIIAIERTGATSAVLQIVGDEDLYGSDYIVEPADEKEQKTGNGPAPEMGYGARPMFVIVNVWYWPTIQYMYVPAYRPWRSPWRWRYYPTWWSPWQPMPWGMYHRRVVRYRYMPCRRVYAYRVYSPHRVYYAHRVVSPSFQRRTEPARTNYAQRTASARPVSNSPQRMARPQNSSAQGNSAGSPQQRQAPQQKQAGTVDRSAPTQKTTTNSAERSGAATNSGNVDRSKQAEKSTTAKPMSKSASRKEARSVKRSNRSAQRAGKSNPR